ncbi:apoptosis-associated speck-like protein containing a CARD [Perognathus longimembris pacificus]|uniref:apoptosis-associated speck-like protein containing a CARD n=1 Tax=Perognathus longimembris pacificus TaxID=214514 RepID=UPI002018B0A3|nr:apoptosis-associated speck-like protein containing a CARD [Perognathus longimembris pacificus]
MGRECDAILEALENLTVDELKKFKLKLLSVPLRPGYGRIPRGVLQSMDAVDLTDKLVSFYLESYGSELTATVLREMGMQEMAERLENTLRASRDQPAAIRAPLQMAAARGPPRPHFVDQHRRALISRVTDVDGVLDALFDDQVLTEEQYQAVRAEATNPTKMRKLYSFTPAWDIRCKDLFLQALRDIQPYLVDDLEKC